MRQGYIFTGVCDSVHMGVCLSACWNTPLERQTPPGKETPLHSACWEIRSTCGRYASYWNAILVIAAKLSGKVHKWDFRPLQYQLMSMVSMWHPPEVRNIIFVKFFFLLSATKLRRLCFYTCLSIHRGGGLPQCPGSRHPTGPGTCCGWYSSYWNAFLFEKDYSFVQEGLSMQSVHCEPINSIFVN